MPDLPVSSFVLNMQGGKKGLLQNSTNICKATNKATALIAAQNGKGVELRPELKNSKCAKAKKRKKARARSKSTRTSARPGSGERRDDAQHEKGAAALWKCAGAVLLTLCCLGASASRASAAGPPIAGALWASQVDSRSATLSAEVDPNGSLTSGYFEYAAKAAYEAKGFSGAKRININVIGTEAGMIPVNFPTITGLTADTTYYYRLVLTSGKGQVTKPTAAPYPFFRTAPASGGPLLPDGRGWEMVSPFDKNGGGIAAPESVAKGGTLQAAAQGGAVTYSSASSFAGGAGAPPASQYVSARTASGWSAQNITVPVFSGSYDIAKGGAPYRLFSTDLSPRPALERQGLPGRSKRLSGTQPDPAGNRCPGGLPGLLPAHYLLRLASRHCSGRRRLRSRA